MGFWVNFFNLLTFFMLFCIFNNNKSILIFMIWAEVLWILLFLISIIFSSWTSSLSIMNSLYILVCTATEISLLTLIFINIYSKK